MATLADLKTRIVNETNRDDLLDDLAASLTSAINSAISFYGSQRFWFNETIATASTVSGNEYVTLPTGLYTIDTLSCLVGGIKCRMRARSWAELEELAGAVASQGQPTEYAVSGSQVRLWPKPNRVYTLTFVGIVALSTLSASTDTNTWTNEGQDLIAARARKILFRDQFRDMAGAQAAAQAEAEALADLVGYTARKVGTGRVRARW